MWMPNFSDMLSSTDNLINYIFMIEYKKILLSFSYIYYATVFFLLTRVLVYFGLTLINLINVKHSTFLKKKNSRFYTAIFLKVYNNNSFKKNFLKLVTVTCL